MATTNRITKYLNRDELAAQLAKDAAVPTVVAEVLSGKSKYVSGGGTVYGLATRTPPAAPAISDEEAQRRLDAIEARRKTPSAPTPAPASAVTEKRAEPAPTESSSPFFAEVSRRMALTNDQIIDEDFDTLIRGIGERDTRAATDLEARRATLRGAPSAPSAATFDPGLELVQLAMRGVSDGSPLADRASRNPSGDLVRLALQDLTDFGGPLDAA